jgi:hypothetical protein
VVTHHVSGGATVVGCALITVGLLVRFRRHRWIAGQAAAFTMLLLGAFVGWELWRGANVNSYFGAYFSDGYHGLLSHFTHKTYGSIHGAAATATRTPFSGSSQIPLYEKLATYLSQPLLLGALAYVVWRRRSAFAAGMTLIFGWSALYFILLPLLTTAGAQDIAHRSWAFGYIGLSIVIALSLDGLVTYLRHRPRHAKLSPTSPLRLGAAALVPIGAAAVLLVGGYGAGVNTLELFPGKPVFQSDGRNVSAELVRVADWINSHGGHGAGLSTDAASSRLILATTLGTPYQSLAYQIVVPAALPSAETRAQALAAVKYVVVDSRLATQTPASGFDFYPGEPLTVKRLPEANLQKLARIPWLHEVYQTQHYTVYRVGASS